MVAYYPIDQVFTVEDMTSQAQKELLTLRDLIRWGASQFNAAKLYFGHGTDNAFDEALLLVCHALYLSPLIPEAYLDARVTAAEREKVVGLLQERVSTRKPAVYLTHEAWFAGLPFYVDERVLVPRSPLAEWIEKGFEPWLQASSVTRVLDLCTGSGCIAIACARAFHHAEVDAVDISEDALQVAQKNIEKHGTQDQVTAINSDLFSALEGRRYQLIISNPPYVSSQEMNNLPDEYCHEPALGLAAGVDGIDVAVQILRSAARFLDPDGLLVMEVGNSEHALQAYFQDAPFIWLEFERGGHGVLLIEARHLQSITDFVDKA
jgi:ribosomal protein L3 glutamine methyltransferase